LFPYFQQTHLFHLNLLFFNSFLLLLSFLLLWKRKAHVLILRFSLIITEANILTLIHICILERCSRSWSTLRIVIGLIILLEVKIPWLKIIWINELSRVRISYWGLKPWWTIKLWTLNWWALAVLFRAVTWELEVGWVWVHVIFHQVNAVLKLRAIIPIRITVLKTIWMEMALLTRSR